MQDSLIDITRSFEIYESIGKQLSKENLSENITKIIANYKSQSSKALPYEVNLSFLVHLLSEYRLNLPFIINLKKTILKYGLCCIPIKKLRHELRKKYHVK